MDTTHKITSGETPAVGLRVFTNDWEWGTIVTVGDARPFRDECGTYCARWHDVKLDSGPTRMYNCDRLTTRKPR